MLLAYVDESFSPTRYYIGALIIPEVSLLPLSRALDSVVDDAAEGFGDIPFTAELHGHSLLHGIDDWEALHEMPRARIGVYRKAFAVIAEHDVSIIIRGIDREAQGRRYATVTDPHTVVLNHVMERLEEHAAAYSELVLVIADEVKEQDSHRHALHDYRRHGTGGYRPTRITRIVDTIYFAPSHATRLLQAVDLIVYLHHRIQVSGTSLDPRAQRANRSLWEVLEARIVHTHCWTP